MEATDGVIYLAKCAVKEIVPEMEIIQALDLDAVYREASRHMIAAMVGMSLQDAGVETKKFKQATAKAQRKAIVLDTERRKVFEALDTAGIWHMALKGSVIQDWYPKLGMRESADVDVLFDETRAEDLKLIMERLGFTTESIGLGHHDSYHKAPLSCFEMHRRLFGAEHGKLLTGYFEGIEKKLVKGHGYEYWFSPLEFYMYFLAHEYKHYSSGGTGLRSIFDTYVILCKLSDQLGWEQVKTEAEKLGIGAFEEKNRSLATHLFDGALTEDDQKMLDYMASSGAHGTLRHSVKNGIEKRGGKTSYILYRLFMPLDIVKEFYPLFYKHKALLPFLPLYRLIMGFRRKKARSEIRNLFRND